VKITQPNKYEVPSGVDIVVMNCDNIEFIKACLESIVQHTQGKYNLIVVDQNSKDGSREWLIESKIATHLILNDVNVGAWEGRNQGVRAGKHDWIVFLDSDVKIEDPEWLDKLWNWTSDSKVGVIEARVKIWDDSYMFGGFASCMIRRKVFEDIGLFDKHFMIGGDLDFWARFAWFGDWRIAWCDDTDITHYCGRTINRERKEASEIPEHKYFREELPSYIYGNKFLYDTLGKITRDREVEQKKRGW